MPLMPKRVKFRKSQRGIVKGKATRGNTVTFGDYGFAEAFTTHGAIGVKCWIFRGLLNPRERRRYTTAAKPASGRPPIS